MSGQIFISYRRDDSSGFAGRLYDQLSDAFGEANVFMDVVGIEPGLDFVDVLNTHLEGCEALLCVIGPAWIEARDHSGKRRLDDPNDFVRLEIATALERGVRVIPILVDNASPLRTDELPEALKSLARRQNVVISHERFRADVQILKDALAKFIQPEEHTRLRHQPPLAASANKTTGLQADLSAIFSGYAGNDSTFIAPNIPEKRLSNAKKKSDIPPHEMALMLLDFTIFGNANDAMVFTDTGIYYHHSLNSDSNKTRFHIPYDSLLANPIEETGIMLIKAGGETFRIDGSIKRQDVLEILQKINNLIIT